MTGADDQYTDFFSTRPHAMNMLQALLHAMWQQGLGYADTIIINHHEVMCMIKTVWKLSYCVLL